MELSPVLSFGFNKQLMSWTGKNSVLNSRIQQKSQRSYTAGLGMSEHTTVC